MDMHGSASSTGLTPARSVAEPSGHLDAGAGSFAWAAEDPGLRRQVRVPVLLSAVGDALASVVAVVVASAMLPWAPAPSPAVLGAVITVCLGCYASSGLYDRPRLAEPGVEVLAIVRGGLSALGALLAAAVLFEYVPSRTMVVVGAPLLLACLLIVRYGIRVVARHLQTRGLLGTTTLVAGTGDEARAIARTINRTGWLGYRVAGFVWSGPDPAGDVCDGMPVVGTLEDVEEVLRATGAGALIVATSDVPADRIPALVRLAGHGVEVRTTSVFSNTTPARVNVDSLDGIPLIAVRPRRLTGLQQGLKRLIDIVMSLTLLVVTAPLMFAIAGVVRVSSGPGIVFRQERVGELGRRFTIYKFRTMVEDAEDILIDLVDCNEADGVLFKLKDDPRITIVGRFLRKTALDELPQLVNVLKGDMSMVGPRPPLVPEVERYDGEVARRLEVKPGLTGLWQVSGRHELTWDDYVRYDTFYVDNWSVGLDLAICARTVPALLSRRGSY